VVPGPEGAGAKDSDEESEGEGTEEQQDEQAKRAGRRSLLRKQSAQQGFVASNTSPNRIAQEEEGDEEGMAMGLIRKRSSKKEREGSRRRQVAPALEEQEGEERTDEARAGGWRSQGGSYRRGGDVAEEGEEVGDSGGSSGGMRTRGAKADEEVRCAFTPARLLYAPPNAVVGHPPSARLAPTDDSSAHALSSHALHLCQSLVSGAWELCGCRLALRVAAYRAHD
jgi:hypothetical protein